MRLILTTQEKPKKLKRILLSGGGTGGHIYPALALADEFKKQNPQADIRFVGSARGLESKIIPDKGYPLYRLNIGPLHSSVGRKEQIKTLISMPFVFLHCLWILIVFRPQRVMGFGGYASGPIVFMASILFFKTSIWEANVQPGMANKILSQFVKRCYVVFEESLKFFPTDKTKCFGYPVRQDFDQRYEIMMYEQKRNDEAQLHQQHQNSSNEVSKNNQSSYELKILVFGGSQGAKVFNQLIPIVASQNPNLHFTLQTGLKNHSQTLEAIEKLKSTHSFSNLKVLPFLDPIMDYYINSDVVICRSGAGALAELSALGAQCLFVPFAFASDNHQYKNALALSQRGAAALIEEKNFSIDSINEFLNSFRHKSEDQRRQARQKMLGFFKPKATINMVQDFTNI